MIFKKIIEFLKKKYNDCFFVGSTDALPPPLDKSRELDLLLKCQDGDMEARNVLIEHNLRLVVFLAKKFDSTGYDLEDLGQFVLYLVVNDILLRPHDIF